MEKSQSSLFKSQETPEEENINVMGNEPNQEDLVSRKHEDNIFSKVTIYYILIFYIIFQHI